MLVRKCNFIWKNKKELNNYQKVGVFRAHIFEFLYSNATFRVSKLSTLGSNTT